MIEFEKIKFKNIQSYGNSFTEIVLNSHKITLYVGSNGSGKSVILNALVFALYNKPFTKITKSQLINSINKSNLLVELHFKSDNKSYKLIRGLKPNIFEIYENDVLLNQDAKSKDYQEFFEKQILKISYKSFIQVCILGSARFTSFMDLPAADRRTIIEDLLDIKIFSTMNVVVKEKQSYLKSEIQTVKNKLDLISEKLEFYKNTIKEKEKYSYEKIEHFKSEISKYEIRKSELTEQNSQFNLEIVELTQSISDKNKLDSKYIKMIEIQSKLKSNLDRINKDQNFFDVNDSCPSCKQHIDLNHKQGIILDFNEKKFSISDGLDKLKIDFNSIKTRLNDIAIISDNITELTRKISSNNTEILSITNYVKNIQSEIDTFMSEQDNVDKRMIKELITQHKTYSSEYELLIEDKKHYDYVSLLLKDGGVKTQIVKQYLPMLNKYINKYLEQMNFFVNFNIDENFEECIKSRHRDEFSFSNFSEGEKVRINLCLLFAFRKLAKLKNSVNVNIQFFDEIIDGASDEDGIEAFLNLISSNEDSNVFVISHRSDNILDKFDRVIQVEKVKNFSRVKEF